jgi:hypothetical protein
MTLSTIDVGTTANDGTGDPLRTAFQTVNTAITAVNNAVVVGTGTTTFKDDGGDNGLNVLSNGDVTFGPGAIFFDYSLNLLSAPYVASGLSAGSLRFGGGTHYTLGATLILNGQTAGQASSTFFGSNGVTAIAIDGTSRDVTFYNGGSTVGFTYDTSAFANTGAVGINETSPNYRLDVNGTFGFTPGASVTPVDIGDVVFEATSNTTFTVRLKGSDGVVRSGTITLA